MSAQVQARKDLFLQELERSRSVKASAEALQIDRSTAYYWRDDPTFAAEWDRLMAPKARADILEDTAFTLATEGKNVRLLMFMLAGLRPELYRERTQQIVQGGLAPTIIVQMDDAHIPTHDALDGALALTTLDARASYLATLPDLPDLPALPPAPRSDEAPD